MQEITTSRERVLKSVRNANLKVDKNEAKDIDHETAIYAESDDEALIVFAENFNSLGGQFIYCNSEKELAANLLAMQESQKVHTYVVKDGSLQKFCSHYQIRYQDKLTEHADRHAAMVIADHLIARNGCIGIDAGNESGRALNFACETMVVIAYADQIKSNLQESLASKKGQQSSFYSYISGPSRVRTMAGEASTTGHGPGELILFLIESN